MIALPDTVDVSRIADWIELYILTQNKSISKSSITTILEEQLDEVEETKIDSSLQELKRRLSLYGDIAPFEIKNNSIKPNFDWEKYPEYAFCLYFSTYGSHNELAGAILFERLTKCCFEYFLNCQTFHFGFPTGNTFKSNLDNLANMCKEKRCDDPQPFDKDRGIDIVAWKSFGDSRNSSFYILVQCATGGNWIGKSSLPFKSSWRRFISWNDITVLPAISITQIVDVDKWTNAVDNLGFIVDRARLYRTITTNGYSTEPGLKDEIISWCQTKIAS